MAPPPPPGHRRSTLTGTAMDRATAIAERCGGGKGVPGNWMVRCPAHDDTDPSLRVTVKDDRVLLYCFAGCDVPQVLDALGLTWQDLFTDYDWQRSGRPIPSSHPPRRPPPNGEADPVALQFAVDLVIDDVEMLTVEGCLQTLRDAASSPLQWLWLEHAFAQAGMSPIVVWQVLFPQTECPYSRPYRAPRVPTYEDRVTARLRSNGHGR